MARDRGGRRWGGWDPGRNRKRTWVVPDWQHENCQSHQTLQPWLHAGSLVLPENIPGKHKWAKNKFQCGHTLVLRYMVYQNNMVQFSAPFWYRWGTNFGPLAHGLGGFNLTWVQRRKCHIYYHKAVKCTTKMMHTTWVRTTWHQCATFPFPPKVMSQQCDRFYVLCYAASLHYLDDFSEDTRQ